MFQITVLACYSYSILNQMHYETSINVPSIFRRSDIVLLQLLFHQWQKCHLKSKWKSECMYKCYTAGGDMGLSSKTHQIPQTGSVCCPNISGCKQLKDAGEVAQCDTKSTLLTHYDSDLNEWMWTFCRIRLCNSNCELQPEFDLITDDLT